MVAGNLAGPNRAEVDRLYRQWRDRENGPVESDLYTAVLDIYDQVRRKRPRS
jgi:hypothetical protein